MSNPQPASQLPSLTRMIWSSIRHQWRISAAVAIGVACATAVILGALLVGDSMRGSLKGLTIQRLGKTEVAIAPGAFFAPEGIMQKDVDESPVPLILFDRGVVEFRVDDPINGQTVRRAGSVQVIGCDADFWDLDLSDNRPSELPNEESVVLNQSAALELGVKVGDLVTVRLPVEQAVPADSPLGRRDIQSEGLPRMRVVDVIADRGLGRFSLSPSQSSSQNIYIHRNTIAEALDRDGQANLLLFQSDITSDQMSIGLEDIGLTVQRVRREFNDHESNQVIYDYYSVTSERLLLPEVAVDKIREAFPASSLSEASTYLANAIQRLDEKGNVVADTSYSTVTAIDSSQSLPLNYDRSDLKNPSPNCVPVVLNSWASERLEATRGTQLRIAYYEPEVENGNEVERFFDAIVTDVVPITKPSTPYKRRREAKFDQPPTVYNDPNLTPTVPGVTDQDSISDWDLPFVLEREITKEDDLYWNEHRLTPKMFLPLADGQRLFGSRFGKTTSLRIETTAAKDLDSLQSQLRGVLQPSLSQLGWAVRPVRQHQLAASRGTTPFDGLFLSLSFFVILAAIMLIAMLFRLGLVQRAKQFGTLLAIGWTPKRIQKLALGEGLWVAAIGVLLGIGGGVLYAKGVLWALRSWWVGAVTVPFLSFHWTIPSVLIGAIAGWLVAAFTLFMTIRWLLKADAQTLLAGRDLDTLAKRNDKPNRLAIAAITMAILAIIVAGFGASIGGQAAAGGFVGGGMLLLIAGLLSIYARLKTPRRISEIEFNDTKTNKRAPYSLGSMASRNASRHPLRSTLTIGLMATAAFLIVAISAFRLSPTAKGTGGFTLVGQTAQPIFKNLADEQVQFDLIGHEASEFKETAIAPLRLKIGQDASCNNLYRATRPTVLGVPDSFPDTLSDHSLAGFDWAGVTASDAASPWAALATPATGSREDPIPVVIDQNTAMWSLQIMEGVGATATFEYEEGKPITFKIVGLLSNSMLQGKLMIGEQNFQNTFPEVSGYQYFLIAAASNPSSSVASVLENRLGDVGMDVTDASELLSGMLAVQNTYLRTFQSLGGLGLLLGTIGLAVAQLRSVLERRQELAVLRAIGFTRKRIASIVMSETLSLLLLGIGCGVICAVIAVLPHAILNGIQPPILEPLLMVLGIIVFGICAGFIAVSRVSRMPLLESLRSE